MAKGRQTGDKSLHFMTKIGTYEIYADSRQFVLKGLKKSGQAYFSTLDGVLRCILEEKIKQETYRDVRELRNAIKESTTEIVNACRFNDVKINLEKCNHG